MNCATFARVLETGGPLDAKPATRARSNQLRSGEPQQRAANGIEAATMPPIVHEVLSSPGQSLDPETRAFFGPRFGHDFGQVRVHLDQRAAESARQVNALAYTVGQHVVFAPGEFRPSTTGGLKLVAHELAHTLQQGGTRSNRGDLRIGRSDDTHEQAADRMAEGVVSGTPVPSVTPVNSGILQRQKAPTGLAGSSSQLVSGEDRLIASFDVDPGTKRPWNLNQLMGAIVPALSASELAYVRVLGVYPTKANEDDPQGNAYRRADQVRRGLIQWIGPRKFSEDRFDVAFANGSIGEPQVQVMIAYKTRVSSETKTPMLAQAPQKPVPSSSPAPAPLAPLAIRPGHLVPGGPGSPPAPAAPAPPELMPSKPYPGQATKLFSAFLETSPGKKFKAAAVGELGRVWKTTSTGEKIVIISSLLLIAAGTSYGLAKLPPSEQNAILALLVSDVDPHLLGPVSEKEPPGFPLRIPF